MHVYIYDDYLNKHKYDSLLAKIETRLTDLGLNGKIVRLGVMKNTQDAVEYELKRGAKTIVAVGNDNTFNKVINAIIKSSHNNDLIKTPVGLIPISKDDNLIASSLGIEIGEKACDILSARRIKEVDLAKIVSLAEDVASKSFYYLTQAQITTEGTIIETHTSSDENNKYTIEILKSGQISVVNLPLVDNFGLSNPKDGLLELHINTNKNAFSFSKNNNQQSYFKLKKIILSNKNQSLLIDNSVFVKTPVEITVLEKSLNIIVGKTRNF